MGDERLPLIRGRIFAVDSYLSPQRGGSAARVPSLDPRTHRARVLEQLDTIAREVESRDPAARDELATREIIAVHPAPGEQLMPDQLDDAHQDARLIGVVPETGTVLLDVAHPRLEYLRDKIDAFADDARVWRKVERDGTQTVHRENERAVAAIGTVRRAALEDVRGPRLRAEVPAPPQDRAFWFEIACRGGYRQPQAENDDSRAQVARQLHRVGAPQEFDEFLGPERAYFFVKLTIPQMEALRAATDCIYEVELAPPPLRDLRLLEDVTTTQLRAFSLTPPALDAPAVVLLDTGIATGHPLLKPALLSATTAGKEIPSPEDTHGHGTKMAGVALYQDLGGAIERGGAQAPHWIQSSRLLVREGIGTASDENSDHWPALTFRAVRAAEDADPRPRDRVFTLAITRNMQDPPLDGVAPTLWSHAIDVLAYHEGHGRLFVVSAGNARYEQWLALAEQHHPQLQLSEKIHQPAQALNALTVGAYTGRVELPPGPEYAGAAVVGTRPGGISPFTSTGPSGREWAIKPDVVLEGGNLAISGGLPDASVPTLNALTTSNRHTLGHPLGQLAMTSEAAARGAHLAARVWAVEQKLRPETVRGLVVHSASWTPEMVAQFAGLADRLAACGHGVPDERIARECAQNLATIVVEDAMPNAVWEEHPKKKPPKRPTTKKTEPRVRRKLKLFRLPIPETECREARTILWFAGEAYRRDLMPLVVGDGKRCVVPMEGLAQGEQLAWLTRSEQVRTEALPLPRRFAVPAVGSPGVNRSLEKPVVEKPARIAACPTAASAPSAATFEQELGERLARARRDSKMSLIVNAGELHRSVGGYPGPGNRMPICCRVMRKYMNAGDRIVAAPPRGDGASLTVCYELE